MERDNRRGTVISSAGERGPSIGVESGMGEWRKRK